MRYLILLLLATSVSAQSVCVTYRTTDSVVSGHGACSRPGERPIGGTDPAIWIPVDSAPDTWSTTLAVSLYRVDGSGLVGRTPDDVAAEVDSRREKPAQKRAAKYLARVDQWTHAIVRYQARLLDSRLSAAQKSKIQTKLDAAVLKVQDESTSIENEDPDQP